MTSAAQSVSVCAQSNVSSSSVSTSSNSGLSELTPLATCSQPTRSSDRAAARWEPKTQYSSSATTIDGSWTDASVNTGGGGSAGEGGAPAATAGDPAARAVARVRATSGRRGDATEVSWC